MSKRNSTNNASWRGPNKEAGGKSGYNNVQVGVGRRNKFCENIISVPLPLAFTKFKCAIRIYV
ncbi:nitrogen fixation protein NifR [Staphylococcus aureus]|uniref:Nitrogen fixation protein NifR n=1 Tax=Staphylococcus aureus TaxID=1280 RepID=A0AB37XRK7_STAAU|nr:nitrogen fixation protein NifR [Staphylococcus aureus]AUU64628.1 nitrogen fixation protein NifR [Staphylococcus aureus]AWI94838.1 nitrogen fixation protein NifR [Staphylococcus aureus]PNN49288.1 nitrogen fixation protein NifR [Staphylococcus aureus]POZ95385.1 nitrogen fixation protein NifR [Staphylococcus aureus]